MLAFGGGRRIAGDFFERDVTDELLGGIEGDRSRTGDATDEGCQEQPLAGRVEGGDVFQEGLQDGRFGSAWWSRGLDPPYALDSIYATRRILADPATDLIGGRFPRPAVAAF